MTNAQLSPFEQNKRILLINNGIHPGEPEGIDASMMLARNMLENNTVPRDVVICIIPVYNIDGMLNRGLSRVNQNGPQAYGFRGNYQNLDLNSIEENPDSGIIGFLETPRYSTGYAALHNTIGFMPETHMLKPYEKDIRVFDHYVPSLLVEKPLAYIIPQSWQKVIDLLALNGVQMKRLATDRDIDADMYYIEVKTLNFLKVQGHSLTGSTVIQNTRKKLI